MSHPEKNDDQYPVSEIFRSIQGEGNFSGVNSLFIRFQFCNLRCGWCDTKFTWSATDGAFDFWGRERLLRAIADCPARHVIFTGGEPAMFRLDRLADTPNDSESDKMYHVETNGTIIPTQPFEYTAPDGTTITRDAMQPEIIEQFNWVVSPKLANAGHNPDAAAITYWCEQPNAIFKLVINSEQQLDETSQFIESYNIPSDRVYIALEGTGRESQQRGELVDAIVRRDYNYSPRLHVTLWGKERGK